MKYGYLNKRQGEVLFAFLSEDDILTYPTLISNNNHDLISRPTALSVCKSLKNKGLLKSEKLKVRRHKPTDHYYLGRDFDTFFKSIELLDLNQRTGLHRKFILQKYAQRQVDINLVRGILQGKKQRNLPPIDKIKNQSEYELPILALIKTSTSALLEFLFGSWKPYVDKSQPLRKYSLKVYTGSMIYHRHVGAIEHLIFKLVFLTISDLVKYGKVLSEDSMVEKALIGGGREKKQNEKSPILSLLLKNQSKIDFYGGTDTEHWSSTDIPTDADYWLDINISNKNGKTDDSLDIDSSKWREKVPSKVGFPKLFIFGPKYSKLISSKGGVQVIVGWIH